MNEELIKPLSTLTVGEYLKINKQAFVDYIDQFLAEENTQKSKKDDLIFTEEVLKLTGYKKATLYSKVSRFEIPVVSRRTPLTFSRKQIQEWIRNGRRKQIVNKCSEESLNGGAK